MGKQKPNESSTFTLFCNATMVNLNNNTSKSPLSFLLLLFLQHLFGIGADNTNVYHAVENLAINCGVSGNSTWDSDHRQIWIGDNDSKNQFSLIEHEKNSVPAIATRVSPSPKQVPYYTARISRSDFTYSFRVTEGPKFIRLHFFSATYDNSDRSNSLFSVKAGPYTLLKDFNASAIAEKSFSREYCINVDRAQRLNITFIPNLTLPDCYAFINGIEFVSMPANLYYTEPGDDGLKLVGHENLFSTITNNRALETLYRINVGGRQISSEENTGMYRYWDADNSYLEKEYDHSLPVVYGMTPKYEKIPNYTAPDDVYLTARSYGMNATTNYNVTWKFRVDPEFDYMVRLHFCELDLQLTEAGQRVFQIFIADMLAEKRADVILSTGQNLVPYYKDYLVLSNKLGGLKQLVNLSIKLQPLQTQFADDVILNGVEILKVSDISTGNLAGLSLEPRQSPPQSMEPPSKPPKSSKKATIVAIVTSAGSGIVVLSFISFLIYRRTTQASANNGNSKSRHIPLVPSKSNKSRGSSLPPDLCRCFSLAEITAATNNFDEVLVIGIGGFGKVYKGYIDEGTPVAIKRLKPGSKQGAHEFETEIEMLSQLRHLHLVSLIGYCNDGNEMILVYDFMARGTLRDHLYGSDNQLLSWKQRLEICLGVARGLNYLHTGVKHNIIHRDVKTTNILLNENWEAKVSDFGLSKIGPTGMSKSHITTVVKGSLGYLDPEYYKRQRLTLKSDVYSLGVVLLEVLCARPPFLRTVEEQQQNLEDWLRECYKNGEIDRTVDPFLRGTIAPQCLNKYVDMAFNCLHEDGNQRPSMNDLVRGLEFTIQLQDSLEGTVVCETDQVKKKGEEKSLLQNFVNDDEESEVLFPSTDESSTRSKTSKITVSSNEEHALASGMVFSELSDPRGT